MRFDLLSEHLEWAEGRRAYPYEDSVGKLTIGVGRNLDDRGLAEDEIDYLKKNDMDIAYELAKTLPYFEQLDEIRQVVIADLVFNLGLRRFKGFIRTNAALNVHDYDTAADELLDSRYARQTGRRAHRNARVLRTGKWT